MQTVVGTTKGEGCLHRADGDLDHTDEVDPIIRHMCMACSAEIWCGSG